MTIEILGDAEISPLVISEIASHLAVLLPEEFTNCNVVEFFFDRRDPRFLIFG